MDLIDYITPEICTLVNTKYGPMYKVDLNLLRLRLPCKLRVNGNSMLVSPDKIQPPKPFLEGIIFRLIGK